MQFNESYFQQLSRSPQVTGLCVGVAQTIAGDARAGAPVDTEAYKNGIHVELKHQQRSVALVVASDPKSLLIEAKTGNLVRALNKAKKRGRG